MARRSLASAQRAIKRIAALTPTARAQKVAQEATKKALLTQWTQRDSNDRRSFVL